MSSASIEDLCEQLASEFPDEERRLAAKGIGQGAQRVEKPSIACAHLMRSLRSDRSDSVKAWAAWALGRLRHRDAVDVLLHGLDDRNRDVRVQCAAALGLLGDERAVPRLRVFVAEDGDDICIEYGIKALGNFKTRSDVREMLHRVAEDYHEPLEKRQAAAEALTGQPGLPAEPSDIAVQFEFCEMKEGATPPEVVLGASADGTVVVVVTTKPARGLWDSCATEATRRAPVPGMRGARFPGERRRAVCRGPPHRAPQEEGPRPPRQHAGGMPGVSPQAALRCGGALLAGERPS